MDRYPTYEVVLEQGGGIRAIRDVKQKCVYAVVNRRPVNNKCVVTLRGADQKKVDVWATKALRDTMVGPSALPLPVWAALPEVMPGKFIKIVTKEFDSTDYRNNTWAREIKDENIPPVFLSEDSDSEEDGADRRRQRAVYSSDEGFSDGPSSKRRKYCKCSVFPM